MKLNFFIFILLTSFFSLQSQATGITTSFPILTLITSELIDSQIPLSTLSSSGEDAHHFELTPKTLIQLQNQDLLIINGLGFEHWYEPSKIKLPAKLKIVVASEGINPLIDAHKKTDPHAWQDPTNLEKYIVNIQAALESAFPTQKPDIARRASVLRERLQQWRKEKTELFTKAPPGLLLVTAHDSFAYFGRAFGLKIMALLGNHEGESISPRQLTLRLKDIAAHPHRLFLQEGSELDSTLSTWAQKTNSYLSGPLWGDRLPDSNPPRHLLDYLDHNAKLILEGIGKLDKSLNRKKEN